MAWLNEVENREERKPEVDIDRDQLKTFAENPEMTSRAIYERLGFKNDVTFYYQLNNTPGLRKIYDDGRAVAKGSKTETAGNKQSAGKTAGDAEPKPKRKYKARRASKKKSATPPRNGNAKGQHKELFKRLQLEFDHIGVYGTVSEHFEELRTALAEA